MASMKIERKAHKIIELITVEMIQK